MARSNINWSEIKVAFMDAHPAIRAQLKKIFEKMQVKEAFEFKDAASAIEFLENHNVNIIIADIYAEEGGSELIRFVRNRNSASDLPFIVLTGETGEKDIVLASDYGASAYILKPFQADDLVTKMETVIGDYLKTEGLNYHLRLGEEALIDGKLDDAEIEFRKALALDSSASRPFYGIALVKYKKGEFDAAEHILLQNIPRNEAFYRNYRVLADIAIKKGAVDKALNFLNKELSYNEKQPDRQLLQGSLYFKNDDHGNAMESFKSVLVENPKNRSALLGMGQAYAKANNFEKALYYFKRVRRYHPTDLHSLSFAIECGIKAREYKPVETFLRDERKRNTEEIGVYYLIIKWYTDLQNWDEALEMLKEALLFAPEDLTLVNNIGKVFLKRKQLNEACEAFGKLFQLAPREDILEQYCVALNYCQKYLQIIALLEPRFGKLKRAKLFALLIECYLKTGASMQAHYTLKKIMQVPEHRTQENLDFWQRSINSIQTRRKARMGNAS